MEEVYEGHKVIIALLYNHFLFLGWFSQINKQIKKIGFKPIFFICFNKFLLFHLFFRLQYCQSGFYDRVRVQGNTIYAAFY